MDSEKALELDITVNQAGGGRVTATMHDDAVEERLQLLNARGANREGNSWVLETDDMGAFADATQYVVKMVSDVFTPKETPGEAREATFDRDDNKCRLCGADFDAPAIEASDERINTRVLDHIFPQRDAEPGHQVHEMCNLATVCGGCDDVFLQGDKFRFIVDSLGYRPTPTERKLLAWIQKRAIIRSDWARDQMNESSKGDNEFGHEFIVERLQTFANLGLLKPLPDVAQQEGFKVFALDIEHESVGFLNHDAVSRHTRLPQSRRYVDDLDEETYISMNEREQSGQTGTTI